MSFDIEKEAEELDDWLFEHSTLEQEGCMKFHQLVSEAFTRCRDAAILAERERCAKVAETYRILIRGGGAGGLPVYIHGTKIAAALREDPTDDTG